MGITLGDVDIMDGGSLWGIKYVTTDKFHVMASTAEGDPSDSLGTLTEGGVLTLGSAVGDLYTGAQDPEGVAVFASYLAQIENTFGSASDIISWSISGLTYSWNAETGITTAGTQFGGVQVAVDSNYAIAAHGLGGEVYVRAFTSTAGDNSEVAVPATFAVGPTRMFKLATGRAVMYAYNSGTVYLAIAYQASGTCTVGTPEVTSGWTVENTYGETVCLPLDSTHFAVLYGDGDDILYRIVAHSGNSISSVGSEQTLKSGSGRYFSDATVVASGVFVLTYFDASGTHIESGTFTSSTLTLANDAEVLDSLNPPDANAAVCRVHDYHGVVGFYDEDESAVVIQEFTVAPVSTTVEFWQGTNGIGATKRSDLNITSLHPGLMLVLSTQQVIAGTNEATDVVKVESAVSTDSWASWTDLTDSMDGGEALQELDVV